MNLVIGLIIVAVVIAIIFFFAKRNKGDISLTAEEKLAAPKEEETFKEEVALQEEEVFEEEVAQKEEDVSDEEDASEEEKASEEKVVPKEEIEASAEEAVTKNEATVTAPGVRLDESAEEDAAARLETARHERKLKRLRQGLAPTRSGLIGKISALFKGKKEIDATILEDLEETLITSDVGAKTTALLVEGLKQALDKEELKDAEAVWDLLRKEVREVLSVDADKIDSASDKPYTIMVVGVNGVGKTTTIGKLATQFSDQGLKVVLAAADTFRAAAVNQLEIWGRRSGAIVVKSKEASDPSSVVFDAIKKAKEIDADIVIADTAGRLHTKVPLMEELKKIGRVMTKAHENAPHQVLLVLDATTGQNAIQQVAMFKETLELSGIVLTKLDGTAKGGVIIGVCHEHQIPIRFIGIGEAKDDLREFEVDDFVEALFLEN